MKKTASISLAVIAALAFAAAASAAQKVIEVDSAEAFVKAIASGVTIRIKPGRYDITEAKGAGSGPVVEWSEWRDEQLCIKGVRDLTIEGAGASNTELVVTPMHVDVIAFRECENITIKGVTMGHVETGECIGNVLTFTNSRGVTLEDVDLYGCGVIGIEAERVSGLKVTRSVIRDCSWWPLRMDDVSNASFVDTTFRNRIGMIRGGRMSDVTFDRCTFEQRSLRGEEDFWPTIALWEDEGPAKNVKVKDSTVVTEDDPCDVKELFVGDVEISNVTVREADKSAGPHDESCGPDGLSFAYHKAMSEAEGRMDEFEAIFDEITRQEAWMNEYLARALEKASSPQRAKALTEAQTAWAKWLDLDVGFLEGIDYANGFPQNLYRFDRKLEEQVRRTVMLRREAVGPEDDGWKFEPHVGGPRAARDGISRDGEGYSARYRKAIAGWNGNTGRFLAIVQDEIDLQDKWLNELYKELRANLGDDEKTALRDAQRAWLAWRDADGKYINYPDGGSMERMDAKSDFLDKLVRRVVFLESQL